MSLPLLVRNSGFTSIAPPGSTGGTSEAVASLRSRWMDRPLGVYQRLVVSRRASVPLTWKIVCTNPLPNVVVPSTNARS